MHQSNSSITSFYYTAIKRDDENNQNIRCVVFVRASDHPLNGDPDGRMARSEYYKQEAMKYKLPEYKKRQPWKLINVVVDGVSFNTYNEALDYLDSKLKSI